MVAFRAGGALRIRLLTPSLPEALSSHTYMLFSRASGAICDGLRGESDASIPEGDGVCYTRRSAPREGSRDHPKYMVIAVSIAVPQSHPVSSRN